MPIDPIGIRECTCTPLPHYDGPAVDCDVHGLPSAAYEAGRQAAWTEAKSLLDAGFNYGYLAGRSDPVDTTAIVKHQVELLESLLAEQSQELDADGRPMGPPYYVINDDGARWFIESALAKIHGSIPAEQSGDQDGR